MSVLVKDMKMPVSCEDCILCDVKWTSENDGEAWAFCMLKQKTICHTVNGSDKEVATEILKKADWCSLVEVPTPHGRLIDTDALAYSRVRIAHEDGTIGGYNAVVMSSEIKNAPTVIEAEE